MRRGFALAVVWAIAGSLTLPQSGPENAADAAGSFSRDAHPRGEHPRGAHQPDAYPHDAYPRDPHQRGAYPHGSGQHDAYPRESLPPNAFPRDSLPREEVCRYSVMAGPVAFRRWPAPDAGKRGELASGQQINASCWSRNGLVRYWGADPANQRPGRFVGGWVDSRHLRPIDGSTGGVDAGAGGGTERRPSWLTVAGGIAAIVLGGATAAASRWCRGVRSDRGRRRPQ